MPSSDQLSTAGAYTKTQQSDFRRRGVAIVVELDRLEGPDPGGRFVLARAR